LTPKPQQAIQSLKRLRFKPSLQWKLCRYITT